MLRNPVVAGSFYPGNSQTLRKMITDFLQNTDTNEQFSEILGIISPHAGYMYSGQCAAYGFKALQQKDFDVAVMIAPSHRFGDFDYSLTGYNEFLTPLGRVKVAQEIVRELKDRYNMGISDYANDSEHSMEVQIPFLQLIKPEAKIVPIVLGEQSPENSRKLAANLAEYFKDRLDKTVFIVSSDLSHYYDSETANKMDSKIADNLDKLEIEKMKEDMRLGNVEACGLGGILTLMNLAKILDYKRVANLDYRNSGDVSGDYDQVVGYLSSCVYK